MFDAYLEIEGVPGESTASGFEDQIPVLAFSHNVSQPADVASSGRGATSGRCIHADFTITKELDKAGPLLDQKCSDGSHIPKIVLSLVRAGGSEKVGYLTYTLTNCVVSSVSISGGAGAGEAVQNVSFNYGKIEWVFTATKRADGGGGGSTTGSWNLETNSAK